MLLRGRWRQVHGLRCGDLVDVEWEGEYYPGVVTDVPKTDELAVAYTNGDFEESVPQQVARLRSIPPKRKPAVTKGRKGEKAGRGAAVVGRHSSHRYLGRWK